ncbi:MAG: hypothetical protein K8J31_23475, partial [Anaerolineae bacterium]|nr:hypothetical protein [Anaerolineae bacterium]
LTSIAYMPAAAGYPAQLPQILRDFDIDALVMAQGSLQVPTRWQGPDGSSLLVINLNGERMSISGALGLRVQALDGESQPGEPTSLDAYITTLRDAVPDTLRPLVEGELDYPHTAGGRLSARLPLKQANAHLQQQLTDAVEPLLALALTHGQASNPETLRALLRHSWRKLLRVQTPDALGGTGSDAAHIEFDLQARQVADTGAHLLRQSLFALPGQPALHPALSSETYLVVWNPHNWPIQQAVTVRVDLAAGHYPMRLLDAEDREVSYTWRSGVLQFVADAPPVGYTTYTLQLTLDSVDVDSPTQASGTSIGSTMDDDRLLVVDDQLVWRHLEPSVVDRDGQVIGESKIVDRAVDLLRFFDGGDAGDTFHYQAPEPDLVVQASLLPNILVETTRIYQRLILTHRLRLTPALAEASGRLRGVKPLDLVTTATMYHHMPGIYFQTAFENTVKDHRLRVYLRTGLSAASVQADSAFGLMRRPVGSGIRVMHRLCAVEDGKTALALLARGLPEYEAISEHEQVTLALTLLRAVGWRSRRDGQPTPDAQCLRPMIADYALRILPSGDPAALLRAGQMMAAPLQAFHYQEPPPVPMHSYLTLEGAPVVMTALKPPETGAGWIVRLFNPTAEGVEASLRTATPLQNAQVVSLAEEPRNPISLSDPHTVRVTLKPQQVVTLRLTF